MSGAIWLPHQEHLLKRYLLLAVLKRSAVKYFTFIHFRFKLQDAVIKDSSSLCAVTYFMAVIYVLRLTTPQTRSTYALLQSANCKSDCSNNMTLCNVYLYMHICAHCGR